MPLAFKQPYNSKFSERAMILKTFVIKQFLYSFKYCVRFRLKTTDLSSSVY
jgi:hypothetical protein